jgi:TonB family protein
MTSVMRAMSVGTGPRVLRIGLVQGGRVREERVIKKRTTVTVGSSEEASFFIPSPILPPVHALFERSGERYVLNVLDGMTGRIATKSGITELPQGRARIELGDDARGKVVIGHTTLLFQLVDAPPVQPRPQLPLAVKGGLASPHDWSLSSESADSARVASLVARAESMRLETLVAMEGGPAVGEALKRSNVPGVDLSRAAAENSGIAKGNNELDVGHGGNPVQASKTGGLAVLGGPTKSEGIGKDSGKQTDTGGPTAIAQVGTPSASVVVPNADRVVAGLRNRFRSCYQKGLQDDSTMSGKVTISAKIGSNGEVVSSDVASSSGLSPAVGRCIADVVKRATFDAPGAGGSTLQIPVTFVQSR